MGLSFLARGLRAAAVAGVLAAATGAMAQTIYLPVQYQYGRYGEIFYGGRNGAFLSNAMLFMPDVNQNSTIVVDSTGGYVNGIPGPYTAALGPLTQYMGMASPDYRNTDNSYYHTYTTAQPATLIYSDMEPWTEVGHKGFTINDARNEAYFNVPRYQAGAAFNSEPMAAAPEPEMTLLRGPTTATSQQAKIGQLQAWADAEEKRGTHPELVQALHKMISDMGGAKP